MLSFFTLFVITSNFLIFDVQADSFNKTDYYDDVFARINYIENSNKYFVYDENNYPNFDFRENNHTYFDFDEINDTIEYPDVFAKSDIEYANSTELELSDVLANSDVVKAGVTEKDFRRLEAKPRQWDIIKIVAGGIVVKKNEFPFMTAVGSIQTDGSIEYHCGGALIAPKLILTAAHCTANKQVAEFVRIGGAPLDSDEPEHQPIEVIKFHVHPLYKRKQFYHDIALLELKEEALQTPACIWKNHTVEVENVTAIGYGQEVFAGPNTNELLKTTLALISNENCSSYYPAYSKLPDGVVDTHLCAGDFNAVRDTCQGDSGGPIIAHIGEWPYEYPYVLGVTSFGQGCASGSPSIYVRISKYLDWIKEITNENFSCDLYDDNND